MYVFGFDCLMQTMDFTLMFFIPKSIKGRKLNLDSAHDSLSYGERHNKYMSQISEQETILTYD